MKLALTPIIRTVSPQPPSAPAAPAEYDRYLVTVDFESPDGRFWSNLGGGRTLADALASARADLSPEWEVVRWNHAYGV
jgi:hypothetical protein